MNMDDRVSEANEWVILLHGLGRFRQSMRGIEKHLKGLGYTTINLAYPSTTFSIATIAEKYLARAVETCKAGGAGKVHFVAHSLGGIIVRHYLQNHSIPAGSRLVMLAPPNQGSEVVDFLLRTPLYGWLMGPAAQELGTGPEAIVHRLKPVEIEIGVIAGTRSMNLLFSVFMDGADDGRLSVKETNLREMRDFITVSNTHTFIVSDPLTIHQTAYFLKQGRFDHGRME